MPQLAEYIHQNKKMAASGEQLVSADFEVFGDVQGIFVYLKLLF